MRSLTPPCLVAAVFSLLFLNGTTAGRADEPRLAALSSRAYVGTGSQTLIPGISITGGSKTVLIRASGPALAAAFPSLAGQTLANPRLDLYGDPNQPPVASNDDWGTPIGAGAASASTLANTFASVGLGPFASGSKDAALLVTLPPGGYTTLVTGVGGTTGIAVVEVYEVGGGTAKLYAISTRAQVGNGDAVLIPGIAVSAGTGTRRFVVRAAGPGLDATFPGSFSPGSTLANPTISVVNQGTGTVVASNDDWGTPLGAGAYDPATLAAIFPQYGLFPFAPGSKDAALVADFPPGNYTVLVSGVGGGTGVASVEVYDITPAGGPPVVSVAASDSSADESGTNPGEFTFTRIGDTLGPLTVSYTAGGSAGNGTDYSVLPGSITIPAGASSMKLTITPLPDVLNEGSETVTITLTSGGGGYTVGSGSAATVTISDSPATLYVANLRPEAGASGSIASGSATILLSASGTIASVNVAFSNLSSTEAGAHLKINPSGDYVMSLPFDQVSGAQWNFTPTGTYTATDLLNALKSGNLYVGIDTAKNPTGELRGTFIQGAGSQTFTAPPPPPAVDLTHATAPDAARLFTQATFGAKKSDIDVLTNNSLDAWITSQLALPFTSHRAALLADFAAFGAGGNGNINANNRQAAWWKNAVTAPDQLRQRVAFALSELFVVSDVSLGQAFTEGLSNYYDILGNGAFGNFRALLENVTLSPIMGNYLSSLRNAKADPVAGTSPDENYAREVMQLFTVGLNQLQPDGTLKLDANGLPLPTYNQTTITEMAKVFTGWAYPSTNPNAFRTAAANLISPMQLYPAFHDDTVKNIVNGVVIPANQGGAKDLQLALDALFNHPSCPPFVAKQLIQRLVTSNPSPAYVYRVAQKFENNGSGVRGDLAAVVRAILTDYEARSTTVVANVAYGKLKEPLLRTTALLRAFNAQPQNGRFATGTFFNPDTSLDEAALRSPTVFNFFHPAYVKPGALAAAGLVAPEFEITDDTYSIDVPNYLRGLIFTNGNSPAPLDLTYEQTLAGNSAALLDHLNLVLCSGSLPQATRDRITTALAALPGATLALERVQTAILLIATAPAGATQK